MLFVSIVSYSGRESLILMSFLGTYETFVHVRQMDVCFFLSGGKADPIAVSLTLFSSRRDFSKLSWSEVSIFSRRRLALRFVVAFQFTGTLLVICWSN